MPRNFTLHQASRVVICLCFLGGLHLSVLSISPQSRFNVERRSCCRLSLAWSITNPPARPQVSFRGPLPIVAQNTRVNLKPVLLPSAHAPAPQIRLVGTRGPAHLMVTPPAPSPTVSSPRVFSPTESVLPQVSWRALCRHLALIFLQSQMTPLRCSRGRLHPSGALRSLSSTRQRRTSCSRNSQPPASLVEGVCAPKTLLASSPLLEAFSGLRSLTLMATSAPCYELDNVVDVNDYQRQICG